MIAKPEKLLILDGISGVPLGKEICENFRALGVNTVHFDCLKQDKRPFYEIRSAYLKAKGKRDRHNGFYFFPRLVEKSLEALVSRERPSHILVVGFAYKFYCPAQLRRIADQFDARLFLYDTDSCNLYPKTREFVFFVETELPIYDRIFSFSSVTTRFFRETRNLDALHLPFGAQAIQLPQASEGAAGVLFVGSCDLRRIFLLERIKDQISVFGNRWQRNFPLISAELQKRIVDKPVWGDDLHIRIAQAKIVLNITRTDFYGVETGTNLRLFETVAAGSFLLTDYCDELNELFEIGTEIEVFRSSEELADKVRYYLANDEKRQAIARRGYARYLRSHTWRTRIEQLSHHIGLGIRS